MRNGKLQGKIWPETATCCHARHATGRCKLDASHISYPPSKNPLIENLNGWHQNRSGCWKDGTFMTWPEFEAFRERTFREVSSAQEAEGLQAERQEAATS